MFEEEPTEGKEENTASGVRGVGGAFNSKHRKWPEGRELRLNATDEDGSLEEAVV